MSKTAVVIPNYNGIKYLADCLNSLKKQSEKDFGVIVVDDCSTDESIRELECNFSWVRSVKRSENGGFAVAVNDGIRIAKENGAEVIIVAMHWGNEYTHEPTKQQKNIAKYLSSLGVNLIIGAHPHVIQPIDYIGDTLVVYSLGNFISAQKVLGLEKIIGLLVGLEIVVDEESNVTFENLDYQLLYTYYNSNNKNFKIYPFDKLTNSILKNHDKIEQKYLDIVKSEV